MQAKAYSLPLALATAPVMNLSQRPVESTHAPRYLDKPSQVYQPLNTRLLRLATEKDDFRLDGTYIDQVRMLCRVTDIIENGLRIDMMLVDEYGVFRGVVYRSGQDTPRVFRGYAHDSTAYVAIIGHLRKFQSMPMLVVDRIDSVAVYREVMAHRVEVQWAHYYRLGVFKEADRMGLFRGRPLCRDSSQRTNSLPATQQELLKILRHCMDLNPDSSEGISKLEIRAGMHTKVSEQDFEIILKKLVDAGLVLQTEVHEHYVCA